MTEFKPIPLAETPMAELFRLRQRVAELEYQLNTEIGSYASQQIATLTAERDALKQQRDELLDVLILASCCLEPNTSSATVNQIEAAIASVKGKQNASN